MCDKAMPLTRLSASILGLSIAVPLLLTACNTIEGAGRDIRSAGDAISGVARETKEEITD